MVKPIVDESLECLVILWTRRPQRFCVLKYHQRTTRSEMIWSARRDNPGSTCADRKPRANFRNDALSDDVVVLNGALRVERYSDYLFGEGWSRARTEFETQLTADPNRGRWGQSS